jgi:ferrous iron transport protein B
LRIALIGQPNCGKSTLFNQVAGYKAETGNFSGTTVRYIISKVRVSGSVVEIVDLPGTYTLQGENPAEREAASYLVSNDVDVIINVVDASRLVLGLELTLELLGLGKPMIVALNMMDEADRLGLHIDGPGLEKELGVPVLPLVASKGRGVRGLFIRSLSVAKTKENRKLEKYQDAHRHEQARVLTQKYVQQGERRVSRRDQFDEILLHSFWGYASLLLVLIVFFEAVYGMGRLIEPPLLIFFDRITQGMMSGLVSGSLLSVVVLGVLQGIAAGVAIVLPYLLPFLFGLGILEDVGYLPRVAFLMDALMHRIGLHGKAIVPFILGYGCNVPAVMSTRSLDEPRDRYLAAALATLVPCAARLAVVFGLVAYYLGPLVAFALYLFNLLVIAFTGRILSSIMPEDTPGLILEMPAYRVPTLKNVIGKAWFRIREFVVEAWPLLIVGSAVLAALNYYDAAVFFNWIVRPVTWSLGLPSEVGVPLIFGILRKELSLVMLGQALGTVNFNTAMSVPQMVTYTTFVMFYLPCLATLSVLRRELGTREMFAIAALTVVVAQFAAWIAWGVSVLFI